MYPNHSSFSTPNVVAIFQRGHRITGASNARGVGTNHVSGRIAGYWSMTAGRASNNCDGGPCSLSHRRRRISEFLFITACTKRTEQNLIARSGKSEAEVTNNKRRRSRYRTAESNIDRHQRSRGLSAELIVSQSLAQCTLAQRNDIKQPEALDHIRRPGSTLFWTGMKVYFIIMSAWIIRPLRTCCLDWNLAASKNM